MNKVVGSLQKRIILGDKDFILSRTEYKRVLLTGQLCLLSFTVCMLYLVLDLLSGIYFAWPFQGCCAIAILVSWWLNRKRKYLAAKIVLGITINFTVFLFVSNEEAATGLYMFFLVAAVSAFAVFGFEEKGKAFFFAGLSLVLFFASFTTDFHLLPRISYGKEYTLINLLANFTLCTVAAILVIYFLVKGNYRSETILRENEERIITQNEELTKINNELDRFFYSTSHDLRAPLTSIQGLLQLTELTDDVQEIKRYMLMMQDRITHLDKFIHDISDYSRNNRTEIKPARFLLKNIIRESLENLAYYPGADRIRVEVSVAEEMEIITDVTRLRIVLNNLISNAFKYYDPNKSENKLSISASETNTQIIIRLEDNGIGISAEYVPRIFDMFFQAHDKSIGSGLGLYIVKETVSKLKGSITVQSEIRKGSVFTLTLPVVSEED